MISRISPRVLLAPFLCALFLQTESFAELPKDIDVDVCIYGATSGGVIAAVAARRQNCSVLLVEPKRHVGGLTAGGLGETDIGRPMAVTGLARQFYRAVGQSYGVFEAWNFEPHVAEAEYLHELEREHVQMLLQHHVTAVEKDGTRIRTMLVESTDASGGLERQRVRAKVYLDCTYEGDLMALAGVSYAVGREANSVYNETKNGVEPGSRHQFPNGVDPYVRAGDPSSGLIFGVKPEPLAPTGSGDKKVQAYCFRLCLTKNPANQIPFTKPDHYDPATYELSRRLIRAGKPKSLSDLLIVSSMPNQKTDINSLAGQSTDFYGFNWGYPEGTYAERAKIWQEHEEYTKGLVWFLANDEAVPENIRREMGSYGWPKDEYRDNHGFTHELYVREARRMVGEYVMTEQNCRSERTVEDGVALASYNMDAHHVQTVIVDGIVKNEGEVTVHLDREYPVSYRALTPKREECTNLLVPVCLSASHIAYGSIRMEPVFMSLGQAAGLAAGMAVRNDCSVQEIDVAALRHAIESDPYLDGRPPDVYAHWSRQPDRVEREGEWKEAAETAWASNERFLRCEKPAARQRLRFRPKIAQAGVYDVVFYNPVSNLPLKHGQVSVHIRYADGEANVSYDPAAHSAMNSRTFSFGQFSFRPGADAEVELIADGLDIPVQAMLIDLVAKPPQ
ncbi:MAG: FAD-dependent oxidoreductase [Chthoniobacter sp.]|nr:FAD-dependent oxidoreductase [Chthoniobacter sp.]